MMNLHAILLSLGLLSFFTPGKVESSGAVWTSTARILGRRAFKRRARGSTESRSRSRVRKDEKGSKGNKSASTKSEEKSNRGGSKSGKPSNKRTGNLSSRASGKHSKRGKDTESRQSGSQRFGGKKVTHDVVHGGGNNESSNYSSDGEGEEGDNNDRPGPRSAVPTIVHSTNSPNQPTVAPFTNQPTLENPLSTAAPSNLTADVCSAFYAGTARRTEPRQDYKVRFVLEITENADEFIVLEDMGNMLNDNIAPFLLGCEEPQQTTRSLQSVSTEYVNVIFSNPVRDIGRTCSAMLNTSVCVPTIFDSKLYFDGGKPSEFEQELSQVLQSWDWSSIDGFQMIRRIEVAQVEKSNPFTSSSQSSRAGIIFASTALLATILVLTMFAKRIRNSMRPWKPTYAWLSDVDELFGAGRDTPSILHPTKSVRFNDQITYISCESRRSGEEFGAQWSPDGHRTHPQELECSSPSCIYCESKRQSGIGNSPVIDSGLAWSKMRAPPSLCHEVEDCVFL